MAKFKNTSGITLFFSLKHKEGFKRDYAVASGKEVDLPADHDIVKTLEAKGHLTLVEDVQAPVEEVVSATESNEKTETSDTEPEHVEDETPSNVVEDVQAPVEEKPKSSKTTKKSS